IVSKTSELLPEPETPVNTVSRRFGISTLTSLRLFTRAPSTRIRSWLSAGCPTADCWSVLVAMLIDSPSVRRAVSPPGRTCPDRSTELLDADHVARRVAEGAVTDAIGLIGRLLDHLRAAALQRRERAIEVLAGQVDAEVAA